MHDGDEVTASTSSNTGSSSSNPPRSARSFTRDMRIKRKHDGDRLADKVYFFQRQIG